MNLQTFTFHQQTPIRAALRDGEPWFVAKDVCLALGISWSGATLARVQDKHRGMLSFNTPGGPQSDGYQPEPGERGLDAISIAAAAVFVACIAYLLLQRLG